MSKSFFLSLGILILAEGFALGSECAQCVKTAAVLKDQISLKARTEDLLGKNQRYLASLSAKEASKFLKLSSNVTQILRRLDQLKKQAETTELEMQKMNCQKCENRSES